MPTYCYRCEACDLDFEKVLRMSEYDDPQNCPECEIVAKKVPARASFILPGDDWASKNGRVAKQMEARRKKLDEKKRERKGDGAGIKLVPNVGGEVTDSWAEASKLAKSKGKDTAGYDARARTLDK